MPYGAIIGALIGGEIQAGAAADASEAQGIAGDKAMFEQRRQYDLIRGDQQPYRQVGVSSLAQLAALMGLGGNVGSGGGTGLQMDETEERSRLMQMLEPSFRRSASDLEQDPAFMGWTGGDAEGVGRRAIFRDPNSPGVDGANPGYKIVMPAASGLDQAGLQAEVDKRIDLLRQSGRLFSNTGQTFDRNTGAFSGQRITPGGEVQSIGPVSDGATLGGVSRGSDAMLGRSFSMADLQNDPVYQTSFQFGLEEGRKGLERRAGAAGANDSGATLKALTRFGSDYAGQKAGESYNRFNTNQTNQFNRLATLAGIGQTANNQVGTSGMNMANNISGIQQGIGNAQAGSMIGQGNAWSGAAQGAGNWWSGNQQLNRMQENRNQGTPQWQQTSYNNPYYDSGSPY